MKSIRSYLLICAFMRLVYPAFAQSDTVQFTDVLGVRTDWVLWVPTLEYSYHKASRLLPEQIVPLLKRSPNADVRQGVARSRRLDRIGNNMMGLGFLAMPVGLALMTRRPELSGVITLVGSASFYGSMFPLRRADKLLNRSVKEHNQFIRAMSGRYYNPDFSHADELSDLTLADTVLVKRSLLGYSYQYRGLDLLPEHQLQNAYNRLGSERLKSNSLYIGNVRRIGNIIQLAGTGTLFGYLSVYGLRRLYTGTPGYFDRRIFWGGLGASVVGMSINFHVDQVESRSVRRYNALLRDRVANPAGR